MPETEGHIYDFGSDFLHFNTGNGGMPLNWSQKDHLM